MSKTTNKYSPEVRERAVRMVFDHQAEHASQWATILSIAPKIGCNPETLRSWVRQAERDRIKALEGEVRELRQANEILKEDQRLFRGGGARPPVQEVMDFMEAHVSDFGGMSTPSARPIRISLQACRLMPRSPRTLSA
jgi:transposase-like protein